MTEASNESLYKSYNSTFQELIKLQRKAFELAFKKGWYFLEKAETNKIDEKLNMLSKEYQDLNID